MNNKAFEILYDAYSATLYGIARKVSPSVEEAESIVIATFEEIYHRNTFRVDDCSLSFKFIKIMMKIAHDRFNPTQLKNCFKLQYFENVPLLHYLICEQNGIEQYCHEHNITRGEALKKLHQEYLLIQSAWETK